MSENVKYNNEKKQFELGAADSGPVIDAYTKTESDNKFATKAQVNDYLLKTDATSTYATKATVYTKTESDSKFATKAEMLDVEARLTALEGL